MAETWRLADLTTLRVGGTAALVEDVSREAEFIDAVRDADTSASDLLVLGGGSNLVVSDAGFPGIVVRDRRSSIAVIEDVAGEAVTVTVAAGTPWDEVVERAVAEGWVGVEALSGIPGSTGATPVQNVGAYGQEVADTIASVRVWDRAQGEVRTLTHADCRFGYRDSLLKGTMRAEGDDGDAWSPTPRLVVLEVSFRMSRGEFSAPIAYSGVVEALGVAQEARVPLADVREAVLALRRSKGMVLDAKDPDTWSAGSFFTNPILSATEAARLPQAAPRYAAGKGGASDAEKTSAAWLIENAGFGRGYSLSPDATASLSTKHALAITNRGGATAADIVALARRIREGVRDAFGISLEPEPVLVGIAL
jgi:UDP-N-acetylmuramate dehydrogenase